MTEEGVPRALYDKDIAAPIAGCLKNGGLVENILYIVTTQGVPLRISGTEGLGGEEAAVDSELTLLYSDITRRSPHPVAGSVPNPFFGYKDAKFAHPQFPIYLVTRLAAYSSDGVKAIIDRSLKAENRATSSSTLRPRGIRTGTTGFAPRRILLAEEPRCPGRNDSGFAESKRRYRIRELGIERQEPSRSFSGVSVAAGRDHDRVRFHQRTHFQAAAQRLEHQRLDFAQTFFLRQPSNHDRGLHS